MLPDKLFRHLPASSQHPLLHRLKYLIGCLQPFPVNVILAISKLAHITAAIKAAFTAAQDSPKRSSTTEESASEFLTFSAHDLFMRGEQSNQTRKSPQVGGFMCVWKFLSFIHSQPSDYSGGAGISCVSETLVLQATYLSVSLSSVTTCWASKPFLSTPHPSTPVFPSFTLHLLENLCNLSMLILGPDCTNTSRIWMLVASVNRARTNTPTPGVFVFSSRRHGVYTSGSGSKQNKTRQVTSSDGPCLTHSLHLWVMPRSHFFLFCFKCEQASPDIQRRVFWGFFFKEYSGVLTLVSSVGRILLWLQGLAKPKALNLMWSPACVCVHALFSARVWAQLFFFFPGLQLYACLEKMSRRQSATLCS